MSKSNVLKVQVGDIVMIDMRRVLNKPRFKAKVMQVQENATAQTIITYERLDAIRPKFPLCNVSLVSEILERAPYMSVRKMPQNIFRTHIDAMAGWSVSLSPGVRRGSLAGLAVLALAKVRHIDLVHSIHEGRLMDLYKQALWPGMKTMRRRRSAYRSRSGSCKRT